MMRSKAIFGASALGLAIFVSGCSSSTPTASPAETKAFQGGPPPAGYMSNVKAAQSKGDDLAAKAKDNAMTQHGGN